MIDLRSDTVTLPSPAMREAMATAKVGDDVYGEDPTINRLEQLAADKLGKPAAMFVPSGTQSNLTALLTHCQRGEEYIVGQMAHTYRYEAGGAAVLGSIQPQPIEFEPDGTLDLNKVKAVIKPDDPHFAPSRLLCLENTNSGKVLPMSYMAQARQFCDEQELGLHLDGARLFNAAVKLGIEVREIAQYVDSVSVCLSKGLSAPVGSVLCGSADFIQRARRWRKMLGGGMRQAGVLAAAGIIALTDMVERLADDHATAQQLAQGLAQLPGIEVDLANVQTNMVFFELAESYIGKFAPFMKTHNIIIGDGPYPVRAVTHYGIDKRQIEHVLEAVTEFVKG
ncbi:low-specificity L-threonine aldolase [Anaerolineales bacterium HSG6]|nr:low-specificity L-threonine aldolase [Anaerolineales bacterium HSG6]MDM8530856.1 low-specificity L-threonine aldolase [Anaerolineales bacterium HSG25]